METKGKTILIVEDDPSVALALKDMLESEGYAVLSATDGSRGFEQATTTLPDLVVLDLMLPKMNGLEVCQRLRADGVEVPIIMLTARGEPSDAAFGLKLGADDYVSKPFDVGEFLARVEAILRRRVPRAEPVVSIGRVQFDLRRMSATRDGERLELSPREFEILQLLIAHAGETVTREQMLNHIWGQHASLYTRAIDAHITRLRHKIEDDPAHPRHIITVHRVGYRFVE